MPRRLPIRFAERDLLLSRDLSARSIRGARLVKLLKDGALVQRARGLYMTADADVTEHHSLAEVARLAPNAVVCLLSALRFHGLGTQLPSEVWLAIHVKAWRAAPHRSSSSHRSHVGPRSASRRAEGRS